ncbi:MAG TPA: hypothetical protein PKE32_06095, partial [Miltoncostaeaceae bacterium]|nr:hypothetical protein [Miltoncostaeaceae bacterium]
TRMALVVGMLLPDSTSAGSALAQLRETVGGSDLGAPALGPNASSGWLQGVIDGNALAFQAGNHVVLVLAADSDTARELGRALSGG